MKVVKTWPSVVLPKPEKNWSYMSSPVFDTLEEAEQYVEDYRQKVLLRGGRVRSLRIVEEPQ